MAAPVTVAVVRNVRAGCEAAFESALHEFIQNSLTGPGQLGVHVLRPEPGTGSREYGILRQFADAEARDAFYKSPLFVEWQARVNPMTEGEPRYENVSGLETWFTLPGRRAIVPPPRWKMAVATFLGVLPVAMLLNLTIGPRVQTWPFVLGNVIFNVCVVVLLTWLVMPLVTRLLRWWLYPREQESSQERS